MGFPTVCQRWRRNPRNRLRQKEKTQCKIKSNDQSKGGCRKRQPSFLLLWSERTWRTSVLYAILDLVLIRESTTEYLKWNTRQPPKGIAAAPLLSQRLPAGRKKQTLKVSEFQSQYIVSSKIWREIISRWFDVLCAGSFCRYSRRSQKVYKNSFAQTAKKFPVDDWWGLINKPSRWLPIEGKIKNWKTVRMGYDLAKIS